MKAGVAMNLTVLRVLRDVGARLSGRLIFETVVDEEFGGVNGTLAGRLMGFNADAAIVSEPTALRICAGQRGGRVAHVTLSAPGGVLTESKFPAGVIGQLTHILSRVPGFAKQRRQSVQVHELYAHHPDPVPVAITKVHTGPWGNREPITVPETCLLEVYWQAMPGERKQDVEREFLDWLEAVVDSAPALFATRPRVEFPWRWLPGSAIPRSEPVVDEFAECARAALGNVPPITGIEGPCDLYVFHEFHIPAILWGARGGNTHAADEYLEIDSAIAAAKALLLFICRWCGVSRD